MMRFKLPPLLCLLLEIILPVRLVAQPLAGVYTIGGASPDYATVTAAVNALKLKGISDSVIFNIRTGTYLEKLNLSKVVGTSAVNTITFQSETQSASDVIITYNFVSPGVLVTMDTTSHYHFRYLTFKARKNNYGDKVKLFVINDTCTDLLFYRNSFEHYATGNYNYGIETHGYFRDVVLSDNYFLRVYNALAFAVGENVTIRNNTITQGVNFSAVGIKDLTFTGNSSINNARMFISYCTGNTLIDGNDAYALSVYHCSDTSLQVSNNMMLSLAIDQVHRAGFYFNTVKGATEVTNSDTLLMFDNIFNGQVSFSNVSNLLSDYNLYNSTIEWNGTLYSLSDYQTLSSLDSNSHYLAPDFKDTYDLHINSGAHMNNLGTPINGITLDYDGDTRSSTTPDIGADEFDLPAYDLSVLEILHPTINPCPGPDSIMVRVINAGANPITVCSLTCQINDSIRSTVVWNGLLNTADTTAPVWVFNPIFMPDSSYTIKIWTSDPNGMMDQNHRNDTSAILLYTRIPEGAYTVSGANPKYATLTDALDDLQLRGMCGSVTFNIRGGSYYTSNINRLYSILGNTNTDTIVIQAESGFRNVTLRKPTGYTEILNMYGIKHITLRNLTLERFYVNGTEADVLTATGSSLGTINLVNDQFISQHAFGIDEEDGVIVTIGGYNKAIVKDNIFSGGTVALVAQYIDSLEVSDNQIYNQFNLGVKLNYIPYLLFAGNNLNIQYFSNFQGYSLVMERVFNMAFHHNYLGSARMINCNGTGGFLSKIYNNVFYDKFFRYDFDDDNYDEEATLYVNSCDSIEFANNTIVSDVLYEDNYGRAAPAVYWIGNGFQSWINNIIVNSSIVEETNYALYSSVPPTQRVIEYNDIFSLHSSHSSMAVSATNIHVQPDFIDADLHHFTLGINNMGTPVSYVTDDMDHERRDSLYPDIGADEYYVDTCTVIRQDIVINQGWNMISSYIIPDSADFLYLLSDIATDIQLVKDQSGQTVIPSLGINNIGNWDVTKGYQVKAAIDTVLKMGCHPGDQRANPTTTPVSLPAGWSIIPYLRTSDMNISQALSTINNSLILVKDNSGNSYIPALGINTIGDMQPGKAYKVKMSSPGVLIYPAN